jgi:hypothetical protein
MKRRDLLRHLSQHAGQTHLNSVIHAQQGFQPLVTKINNRQNLCPVSILKIRCACPESTWLLFIKRRKRTFYLGKSP